MTILETYIFIQRRDQSILVAILSPFFILCEPNNICAESGLEIHLGIVLSFNAVEEYVEAPWQDTTIFRSSLNRVGLKRVYNRQTRIK